MAFHKESIAHIVKGYHSLKAQKDRYLKETRSRTDQVMEVLGVNGAAFGWGFANAKWGDSTGELEVLGIPADLGAGLALIGCGMFGMFGNYDGLAIHVGNGSTAPFSYRMGQKLGGKTATKAATKGSYAGALPPGVQRYNLDGSPTHAHAWR